MFAQLKSRLECHLHGFGDRQSVALSKRLLDQILQHRLLPRSTNSRAPEDKAPFANGRISIRDSDCLAVMYARESQRSKDRDMKGRVEGESIFCWQVYGH
jgi:hypothetical protein